jgi:hypothetical protein
MSLTFPKTNLLAGLRPAPDSVPFRPLWRQEISRTAGGETLVKELGPLLWQAKYTLVPLLSDAADALETDLLTLDGGAQLFEGYDLLRPLPASDKVSLLAAVAVLAIQADRKALRLTGLPAAFVVSRGDWLSIDDGTNLHLLRCVETVTADAAGLSPFFEVRPAVRQAVAPQDPVTLRFACARFMLDKDSMSRASKGQRHATIAFSATQVIT